ncbi:MAG: tetratricopeptide repeat protein [Methylococcales bacterium]|nr:tetratricopeptide repeat protein [Methylococcales bacterium]
MKQQKCIICLKTKGKRGCLIKDKALICSRCCAEMRNMDCEGCSYYKDTQKFSIEKARKSSEHFTVRIAPEIDDEIDRALMMVEAGKIEQGEKSIRLLLKENADLYSTHYAMGTIYGIKNQYDEAMKCFDRSIELFPYSVECWFNRALTAQNKMDIVEMITSFKKVIEIGGEDDDEVVFQASKFLGDFEILTRKETGLGLNEYIESLKQFDIAFDLMQSGQWRKAISGYQKAIAINSTTPQAFGNMALCYGYLNENENAIEAFDKAIELDPTYEPAAINKEIFMETIAKGLVFSEMHSKTKVIEYTKDYSVENNKLLIDDYLDDSSK